MAEHLLKLGQGYTNRTSDGVQEARGTVHLQQYFEVYGQAICHYAHPGVVVRLQEDLSFYRFRLAELPDTDSTPFENTTTPS